ncbi:DUF4157 domain-containing protein [Sphingomonas sp. 37zxx]|uniref:DUF4157 domain-containing protein n=1 Tax=Sphingomonas sp. 37zxx TaxID=1550073 RepID=UPI0009DEA933|nr:DUF4157 domain-containing protein [Sphingomonas sp. 37zxx]
MSGRVIQARYLGGRPGPQLVQMRAPGAPPLAAALQAKGTPTLPARALQAHGAAESFAVDPMRLGLGQGRGNPLSDSVRAKMEAAFGTDFSRVRVHEGPQAARIGAIAFTTGHDIYFAPGQYRPETVQGQQLLGHELAHVVQQRQGRVKAPGSGVSVVQDHALEAEADRLGMRAALQSTAPTKLMQRASAIQRSSACRTPGCTNPNCPGEGAHGFDRIYNLRGQTVYHGVITPNDIGQGTGTNQTTRNYVNSPSTNYPEQIAINYSGGGVSGFSEFINQPLNPGQRADAGHIFGNQYGGFGNQSASVFPQHPQTNRGNSYNGQPTSHIWRQNEDKIRKNTQSGNNTGVVVKLRPNARPKYDRVCPHCQEQNLSNRTLCWNCHQIL